MGDVLPAMSALVFFLKRIKWHLQNVFRSIKKTREISRDLARFALDITMDTANLARSREISYGH